MQVKEDRNFNKKIYKLARIGGWELDLKDQKMYWSSELHKLLETTPTSINPGIKTLLSYIKEDFKSTVENNLNNLIKKGQDVDIDVIAVTSSKKEVWMRIKASSEQINGITQIVYGCLQEISKPQKREEVTNQSINDLPGVSFQYIKYPNGTTKICNVSKAAKKIWKLDAEDCEQDSELVWNQIKNGGDFEAVQESIRKAILENKQWNFKWRNILPSDELRWHEGFGTTHVFEDGTILFNCAVFDITEKQNTIELYKQTSRMAKIGSWVLNLSQKDNKDNLFWSPLLREMIGVNKKYNPSKTRGLEFFVEESFDKFCNELDRLIEKGGTFDIEVQIKNVKDEIKWFRCAGKSEFINGKCYRLIGSFNDIDNCKKNEIQLKEITNNLPGVIFQYVLKKDGTENIPFISKGSYDIWGLSPENCQLYPEKVWQQIADGGDLQKVLNSIDESSQNLSTWKVDWKSISPEGTVKYHKGIGTPKRLSNGDTLWHSFIFDITKRKQFELNYQEEKKERLSILDSITDVFYGLDENWNFIYFNKEAETLLKIESKAVFGKNIWEVFPDIKGTIIQRTYLNVSKTRKAQTFEYCCTIDESWYEVNVYPSIKGLSVFFKNIDDRKKAKENFLKIHQEKTNILESIGDAFFALDNDWNITYWNNKAEKITGLERANALGAYLWSIINWDNYQQYQEALDKYKTVTFEEYRPKLRKWFEATLYKAEEGVSVYFKDISSRKNIELSLVRANDRFEKVAQATLDTIWDWDILNDRIYRSQNVFKFFGKSVMHKLGSKDFRNETFHPEDLKRIKKTLKKALSDKNVNRWDEQFRVFHESGAIVHINDRGLIIRDEDGIAIRMIGLMSNISKLKSQEQDLITLNQSLKKYTSELEKTNEELEQFAYIASHDLQEPLRMVSSFMSLLKRRYKDKLDDRAFEYIDFATDGAKRMQTIILDLLEYSRVGRQNDLKVDINLEDLLLEFKQLRRKIISEKSVKITAHNLPNIHSYKAAITQILHALLDNAIKYSKKDIAPNIVISVKEKDAFWEFEVKDNGIGIKEEFQDKIFILFQRLHNREEYSGTGIGLGIVKKQVTLLGGEIWVKSQENKGANFYFTIAK